MIKTYLSNVNINVLKLINKDKKMKKHELIYFLM